MGIACLLLGTAGCAGPGPRGAGSGGAGDPGSTGGSAEAEASYGGSSTPSSASEMRCNPGSGFPVPEKGCPDPDPETGWLTASADALTLKPFRSLGNDPAGEAYAREHDLEFPFANDYYDAPDGDSHAIEIDKATVCTGIIRVGYREPLEDHAVPCGALVKVARDQRMRLPVAVWQDGGVVVQVSELYRP